MGAGEEVEEPREGGGEGWLEVEDRAEVQGLAGGNQLEEGGVVRALLSTLLSRSRSDTEMVLDVACGKCGIVQHPTGTIKECPMEGCHVCCQGGDGGGCNLEDGKAFFTAIYV